MQPVTIPYYLMIPALISFLFAILILIRSKKLFLNSKNPSIWISLFAFLIIYTLIVGGAMITDIKYQIEFNSFDLNKDGLFDAGEKNEAQEATMQRLVNDVGRNFSFITGLIFSGLFSIVVYFVSLGFFKYRKLKQDEVIKNDF